MGDMPGATARTGGGRLDRAAREIVRRIEVGTGIDLRPRLRRLRSRLRMGAGSGAYAADIKRLQADVQELRGRAVGSPS